MSALNTDLYQLTMGAGYFAAGKTKEIATFELLARRLPPNRNFLVTAGLQQAIEYLQSLQFAPEEIAFLRSLPQLKNAPQEYFDFLRDLRFTGDLYAMPEGTPAFAGEPIAIVRAPLIEAQLVETYLLSTFAFQTTIASKAARCVLAAPDRAIVEFGSRRAHSPDAGPLAGRASFIGGCTGTSNTETGMRFGIPVFGTAAHSWTMAFQEEEESFRVLQRLMGESTIFLVDTYDTIAATHLVAQLGKPLWGVRLDSGDIESLSRQVRQILDQAGLHDAKIMATNDLDEHRLERLVRAGAPIDVFGVGTQLATSADAPALSAIYKMVALEVDGMLHYTAKFSGEKSTLPAAKQVYRGENSDTISLYNECNPKLEGEPLLHPVILNGELLEPLPSMQRIQANTRARIAALPASLHSLSEAVPYETNVSQNLLDLAESVREEHQAAR